MNPKDSGHSNNDAAKAISVDAAMLAVLSQLDGIFSFKEEQRTKAFSREV